RAGTGARRPGGDAGRGRVPGAVCDRGGRDRRRAAPRGGRRGQPYPRRRRAARTGADGRLPGRAAAGRGGGAAIARGARGSARRLLPFVFVVAAGVTALPGLDATAVLLTPVVFATAARMRTSPRPHVYACGHLA